MSNEPRYAMVLRPDARMVLPGGCTTNWTWPDLLVILATRIYGDRNVASLVDHVVVRNQA